MIHISSQYGGGYFEDEYEAEQFNAYLDECERQDAERAAGAAAAVATCAPALIAAVRAALGTARLRMIPQSAWNPACKYVPVADVLGRVFWTDGNGDGLYVHDSRGEIQQLLAVREFSLHRYDLSTDTGRRQAREYLRRKLAKL